MASAVIITFCIQYFSRHLLVVRNFNLNIVTLRISLLSLSFCVLSHLHDVSVCFGNFPFVPSLAYEFSSYILNSIVRTTHSQHQPFRAWWVIRSVCTHKYQFQYIDIECNRAARAQQTHNSARTFYGLPVVVFFAYRINEYEVVWSVIVLNSVNTHTHM